MSQLQLKTNFTATVRFAGGCLERLPTSRACAENEERKLADYSKHFKNPCAGMREKTKDPFREFSLGLISSVGGGGRNLTSRKEKEDLLVVTKLARTSSNTRDVPPD